MPRASFVAKSSSYCSDSQGIKKFCSFGAFYLRKRPTGIRRCFSEADFGKKSYSSSKKSVSCDRRVGKSFSGKFEKFDRCTGFLVAFFAGFSTICAGSILVLSVAPVCRLLVSTEAKVGRSFCVFSIYVGMYCVSGAY